MVPLRVVTAEAQTGPFGSQLHAAEYIDNGTPVINPANIVAGRLLPDSRITVDAATATRLAGHRLMPKDVIFARRGELGRAAIVPDSAEGWLCGTGSLRIRLRQESINPRFLGYVLSSAATQSFFAQQAVGSTMENLNTSIVLRLPIPLPEMREQRRIGAFLDAETFRIDRLIEARREQLRLLSEFRNSRLANRISKAIDRYGLVSLRRLTSAVEQGWSPQCDDTIANADEWAVLKTSAVSLGTFDPMAHKRLPSDVEPDRRFRITMAISC